MDAHECDACGDWVEAGQKHSLKDCIRWLRSQLEELKGEVLYKPRDD